MTFEFEKHLFFSKLCTSELNGDAIELLRLKLLAEDDNMAWYRDAVHLAWLDGLLDQDPLDLINIDPLLAESWADFDALIKNRLNTETTDHRQLDPTITKSLAPSRKNNENIILPLEELPTDATDSGRSFNYRIIIPIIGAHLLIIGLILLCTQAVTRSAAKTQTTRNSMKSLDVMPLTSKRQYLSMSFPAGNHATSLANLQEWDRRRLPRHLATVPQEENNHTRAISSTTAGLPHELPAWARIFLTTRDDPQADEKADGISRSSSSEFAKMTLKWPEDAHPGRLNLSTGRQFEDNSQGRGSEDLPQVQVVVAVISPKLNGNVTASGAFYNKNDLTGAHATLAFDTMVRVSTGGARSVVIRINDRARPGRLNISGASAQVLGLRPNSLITCSISTIATASTDSECPALCRVD